MAGRFDPAAGLGGLIAPTPLRAFLSETFEQSFCHWPGTFDFTDLISTARLDHLLASQVFHADMLSMARHEPRLAPDAYLSEGGIADRGLVVRRYQEGATLILSQLHRREAKLADLCRALEADLGHPVQTNIYLTPPTAQGFQTHYDTHDVFILQVEGAKRWRIYDAPAGTVFRGERFTPGEVNPGEVSAEITLTPGDVLYLPRGLMHDAINEGDGQASLHITVGVLARTWADFVLEAVSEVAVKSAGLRKTLPAHVSSAAPDLDAIKAVFSEALETIRQNADLEAVAGLFADRFTTTRPADTRGALLAGIVSAQTQIRRRPLIPMHLADDGDHIALVAPGGPVSFDAAAEAALERLVAGETLNTDAFQALGDEKAHDAIARLVAFGLAETV